MCVPCTRSSPPTVRTSCTVRSCRMRITWWNSPSGTQTGTFWGSVSPLALDLIPRDPDRRDSSDVRDVRQRVRVEHDEVRPFSGLERSEVAVELHAPGRIARGGGERLPRR